MTAARPKRVVFRQRALDPLEAEARIWERLAAAEHAAENLLAFARFMRPDPADVDDVRLSKYIAARPHRAIADALMKLEAGIIKRLIINVPPRHGKTELASKTFIPWVSGRHPDWHVIFGTYNQTFADDIGRAVRDAMTSALYAQVFPEPVSRVKENSQSVSRLENELGSVIAFAGRGGTITGRGGSLLVVDDPIKDRKEADSPTIRRTLWEWFVQIVKSRMMDKDARILLIQTRWHADDLVGRLTDPTNENYHPDEAANWHIVDLPALAMQDDPLGRKQGEPLWPERFDVNFFRDMQRSDPRGFTALYQGRPNPPGGRFIEANWLTGYLAHELPPREALRMYACSDHAVTVHQDSDKTVLMPFGVDSKGDVWIMPDVWWRTASTDIVVEGMLNLIRKHRPLAWFGEKDHIGKAIGPFLRKRMLEEQVFCAMHELPFIGDKQTRAQSIQGRMAMRKVRFPFFAPWFADAKTQMLQFPQGAKDDFVDALALIGRGLDTMVAAAPLKPQAAAPGGMTLGAIKARTKQMEDARAARFGGF